MKQSVGRCLLVLALLYPSSGLAGVSRDIQARYVEEYENKAMFLKIPIRGLRQIVYVNEDGIQLDRASAGFPLAFRVGEQVRIVDVQFRDELIRFKFSAIDLSREGELIFRFFSPLQTDFSQEASFSGALQACVTEGISYTEIESAKAEFVKNQYDEFIRQFASATDTSPDFVVDAISERNPKYQEAIRAAAEVRGKLQSLVSDLDREKTSRRQLQSQLSNLQAQLRENQSEILRVRRERDRVFEQKRSLEQQLEATQKSSREYEQQVDQLASSLDVELAANTNLGQRVGALNDSVTSLKTERTTLFEKVEQASHQLEELRRNNDRLSGALKKEQGARTKLASNLKALTSDRNSLESRYLQTKNRRDVLETSWALQSALRLQERERGEHPEGLAVADLYLLEQKVAVLEVEIPGGAGTASRVTLQLESPDSVRYSDEERRLYESLGEKWTVETAWISPSSTLQPRLIDGELRQQPEARDRVTWQWLMEGEIAQPQPARLLVTVINQDGEKIELRAQEFMLMPAGLMARLQRVSLLSVLIGAILGVAVFGSVARLRRRRISVAPSGPREEYVRRKKL